MKTSTRLIILLILIVTSFSCNKQKPEEVDVSSLVTHCDYIKHISEIITEIQRIEDASIKEPSEAIDVRNKLLHNKLFEIIDYAVSNELEIHLFTNCEGFNKLRHDTISIKLFDRGMLYFNPENYKKSYLYFNLAELSDKTTIELLSYYFDNILNISNDSLSKCIANLDMMYDIIKEKGDKNPYFLGGYDYMVAVSNILTKSASKQSDIVLGEFNFFKLNRSYYRILLPKDYNVKNSEELFGMAFFKPLLMNNFKNISYHKINNLSTKELFEMVSANSFQNFFKASNYSTVYYWLDLTYADQLADIYNKIKKLDQYSINDKREEFVSTLNKLKEQYSIAENNYRQKKFLVHGTCFANEKDYDINTQTLKITLFLENSYLCDTYANMPYENAKLLFNSNKMQKGTVEFIVSPGSGYTYFTSSPYYDDAITTLILLEESNIIFKTSNGEIRFITQDYKGKPLWSGAEKWWRTIQGMNYPDNRIKINAKKI